MKIAPVVFQREGTLFKEQPCRLQMAQDSIADSAVNLSGRPLTSVGVSCFNDPLCLSAWFHPTSKPFPSDCMYSVQCCSKMLRCPVRRILLPVLVHGVKMEGLQKLVE